MPASASAPSATGKAYARRRMTVRMAWRRPSEYSPAATRSQMMLISAMRSIDPRVAVRSVFAHINLKLLFRPLYLPGLVAAPEIAYVSMHKAHAKVCIAEQHPAQVSDVADAAAGAAERAHECDRADDHHEVLGLDGEQETHQNDAVRIEHAESQEQTVDGAR